MRREKDEVKHISVSPTAENASGAVKRSIAWAQENDAAIAQRRHWITENGTPLGDIQVLKPPE